MTNPWTKAARVKPPGRRPAALRLAEVEELELTIDKLVTGGDGFGRFEGIPIFVPRSAPGDHLRVRLTERRPDYGRGEIVAILRPSPNRRQPPCPHFSDCGGCDLQHIEDAQQTRFKVEALLETLQRLGGLQALPTIRVRAGSPWAYRLRTQVHTAPHGEGVAVGYHARGSNRLVAVEACPILLPDLEKFVVALPQRLSKEAPKRLDLAAGDEALSAAPVVEGLPHGEISLKVGAFTYAFDGRCFFQGHRLLLPALVEEAVGEWQGAQAVDLYSGVGLFSLPLAQRYERVIAVEGDRLASRYARTNARRNRAQNLTVESGSVEGWLEKMPEDPDRVLIDPPRTGIAASLRRALMAKRPRRLTYVSCNPATLARDLRTFSKVYRIESLTALDLFPQTGHLETVVQMVMADAAAG
jgi:23S rRNA (uracil1939-C5)-methyltransferase